MKKLKKETPQSIRLQNCCTWELMLRVYRSPVMRVPRSPYSYYRRGLHIQLQHTLATVIRMEGSSQPLLQVTFVNIYSNMYRYVYIYMLYTHTALSNLRSLWLLLIVSHFYKRTQRKRKKTQTGICYIKYGFFLSRFPLQTRLGYCTLKQCLASLSLYFSMSLFI